MAASKLRLLSSKTLLRFNGFKSNYKTINSFYCTKLPDESNVDKETSKETPKETYKWVEFFNKQESFAKPTVPEKKPPSFPKLLRYSKFIDLGNPKGKVVEGTIYHVVGDDLYIDFGWKFPAVCLRPAKFGDLYFVGTKVRLLIKELELATKFLGSTSDTTLCEADCLLLGLSRNN